MSGAAAAKAAARRRNKIIVCDYTDYIASSHQKCGTEVAGCDVPRLSKNFLY